MKPRDLLKALRKLSDIQLELVWRGRLPWSTRRPTTLALQRKGIFNGYWELTAYGRRLSRTLRKLADDAGHTDPATARAVL